MVKQNPTQRGMAVRSPSRVVYLIKHKTAILFLFFNKDKQKN